MASLRLGIAIGRRAARLVIVQGRKRICRIERELEIARPTGASPAHLLGILLGSLSASERSIPLSLALSSGDFACDDIWVAPQGMRAREARAVGPVLLESRSAGETLEGLSQDILISGDHLAAAALATPELEALREAARA